MILMTDPAWDPYDDGYYYDFAADADDSDGYGQSAAYDAPAVQA
jgi:hypothetical protein